MSIQYGYSSALNAQEQKNRLASISAEYAYKAKVEKDSYDLELQRALNGVNPGTKEYELITKTAERELKNKLMDLHVSTVYEASAKDILTAPTSVPTAPKNWEDSFGQYKPNIGTLMNTFGGYNKDKAEYDAKMQSYNRYTDVMSEFNKYMPWNQK